MQSQPWLWRMLEIHTRPLIALTILQINPHLILLVDGELLGLLPSFNKPMPAALSSLVLVVANLVVLFIIVLNVCAQSSYQPFDATNHLAALSTSNSFYPSFYLDIGAASHMTQGTR